MARAGEPTRVCRQRDLDIDGTYPRDVVPVNVRSGHQNRVALSWDRHIRKDALVQQVNRVIPARVVHAGNHREALNRLGQRGHESSVADLRVPACRWRHAFSRPVVERHEERPEMRRVLVRVAELLAGPGDTRGVADGACWVLPTL